MLERPLAALRAGGLRDVIVVLGAHAEEIAAAASLGDARAVVCERWADGQSASLAAGLGAARAAGARAVVVALADQPRLDGRAVARVVAARGAATVVRAAYDGRPGHPTLIEDDGWERLEALRGDAGARQAMSDLGVALVDCDGLGAPDDVDDAGALDAARAALEAR